VVEDSKIGGNTRGVGRLWYRERDGDRRKRQVSSWSRREEGGGLALDLFYNSASGEETWRRR